MDPLTLAILTGVGGQALSQAGNLLPNSLERSQANELKKLKRLQEANALGLTEQEQSVLVSKLSAGSSQAQAQSDAERSRLLAGSGGAVGGQVLSQAVAQDAARAAQQERIGAAVLEADLAREQAQKDKMAALEAAKAEDRTMALQAAGSITGAGLEAGLTTAAQNKIIQGSRNPSPQLIATTKNTYGFKTDDEARGFIELQYSDPTAAKLMTELMITKAKSRGTN